MLRRDRKAPVRKASSDPGRALRPKRLLTGGVRLLPALFPVALLLVPIGVRAQTTPVVLELFTSQGCSSCPPADSLLTELASRDGVIALALHVDYWDYLGWKDDFGDPSYTERQRAYAKANHSRTIFTPEMVVQGQTVLKGHDEGAILDQIERFQTRPAQATIQLERDGDDVKIALAPVGSGSGPADIYVVGFIPSEAVAIEAGENAGETLTYTNIVTDLQSVGRWDGTTAVSLRYEGAGDGPLAIIVQRTHMGPVLTAAKLD